MQLLKGCPGCKGTRFFYTDTILDDQARAAKAQQNSGDLRTVLETMAKENKLSAQSISQNFDDWLQLAATPPSSAVGPAAAHAVPPTNAEPPIETAAAPAVPSVPKTSPANADAPPKAETSVGTVQVHEPGNYSLDVERLLAASPIVIEKEGVYMIHLASAFEAPAEGAPPLRRKR